MSTNQIAGDPIVKELDRAIFAFLLVKRRYPVLLGTAAAMEQLRKRRDIRPVPNHAAIQLMRDSFDMLVIDLYSIRESLTKDGLFGLLRKSPDRLSPTLSTAVDPYLARLVTSSVLKAAKRLNGTDQAATAATVQDLCNRFRRDTAPLDADRNRVRAHRYQQKTDTSKLFIVLPNLQGQIDIVRRYLSDLYLVITHNGHSMDLAQVSGNLAEDMADIIVHGSINEAVNYYGVTRQTSANPTPWYWHARSDTLKKRAPRRAKHPRNRTSGSKSA